MISLDWKQFGYQGEEKKKEIFKRFIEIMQKLNISINYFKNKEEMNYNDEKKLINICSQYLFRLQELNQQVASNELFLFSILIGRINAAKVLWKRGKVRTFKIYLLFL